MLFQEDATNLVLSEAGQVLLTPSDIGLELSNVKGIFLSAVDAFSRHRPILKKEEFTVFLETVTLPANVQRVVSVLPRAIGQILPGVHLFTQPVPPIPLWNYDLKERVLTIVSGTYLVEYLASYTVTTSLVEVADVGNLAIDSTAAFKLKHPPLKGTLIITLGADEVVDDSAGVLDGPFATGTVNYETGEVTLTAVATIDAVLAITYRSDYPAVVEMKAPGEPRRALEQEMFLDLYGGHLLMAYANAKSIMRIEGIPIDINLDQLRALAQLRLDNYEARRGSEQKWWAFQ